MIRGKVCRAVIRTLVSRLAVIALFVLWERLTWLPPDR
jgi:hypothetical protein